MTLENKGLVVFDIEANGLLDTVDKIWVISSHNVSSGEDNVSVFNGSNKDHIDHIKYIRSFNAICGHNIIAYDIPLLKKIYPPLRHKPWPRRVDTLILSKLLHPDIERVKGVKTPHSIEAWAVRLGGELKVEQEQWDTFDPNMVKRCKSDVRLTTELYHRFMRELNGY